MKVLCIAMLLSGAAANAETDHRNITWAGVVHEKLNEGPRQALLGLGTIASGVFAGGVVGLLLDQTLNATEQNKRLIAAVGSLGAGALVYYKGEQLVADAFGAEKIGLAKTTAAVTLTGSIAALCLGFSIMKPAGHSGR